MYVGTIHGFCQNLLQTEVPDFLKYEVLEEIRQRLYIARNSNITGFTTSSRLNGNRLRRYTWGSTDLRLYIQCLSALREEDLDLAALEGCSVVDGLAAYREKLNQDGYFDFSEMLVLAVEELSANGALRTRLAERIKYLVVDEYQDVNPIQERLIRLIHDLGAGLCVVGDDDQTIYQWRGSSVSNIITFQERYPDVTPVRLEANFRSSSGVIETARDFIAKLDNRLSKAMQSADAQPYEADDVVALALDTPEEEARYVAETIEALRGTSFQDNPDEQPRGLDYSDMAILLRSVRREGAKIAASLRDADIPFVVQGLADLFETYEAQMARDLFHCLADAEVNGIEPPSDDDLRGQLLNPRFGFERDNVEEALKYANEVKARIAESPYRFISLQRIYLDLLSELQVREERMPEKHREAVMFNLGAFSKLIGDWESVNDKTGGQQKLSAFAAYIHYNAPDLYSEGESNNPYGSPNAVRISTVHQAKGKQWPVVFLPALQHNIFPAGSITSSLWQAIPRNAIANPERYDGSLEDERRLFYVAMTRSQKFLHMTWAPYTRPRNNRQKSEFWDDVLASKWVRRSKPDYSSRTKSMPRALAQVSNVEFSFSHLKHLLECQYQFKLRVLYGFDSPLALPMGYGKSLHDALAEIHQNYLRGEPVDESQVPDLVGRHLRLPYANRQVRRNLERSAHESLRSYIKDNAGALPRHQEPGHLRLPGHPVAEQATGHATGPLRIHRAQRERHRHRQQRHRQDPRRPGTGPGRLPAGNVGGFHHRRGPGPRTHGGQGRPQTAQPAAAAGPPQSAHHRRTGLRAAVHHRRGTALRGLQPTLRARLYPSHHQPALRRVDEVFGSERLTGALLDRLTHHVHILEMNGDSYRLKGSRQSAAALAPASDRPAAD